MATQFDWDGFRELAGNIDAIVKGKTAEETLAGSARKALSFLYAVGVTMPSAGDVYDQAGGDGFWDRTLGESTAPDPHLAEGAVAALQERLTTSVELVQPDAEVEDVEDLLGAAALGLWECAAGLAPGIRYFDDGRKAEAAWEWTFGFDEWGTSALNALIALHELLWGAEV